MKTIGYTILALILFTQCTKEKQFENGIHGKWNIDRYQYYQVHCSAGAKLIQEKQDFGTIKLTTKKYPSKVAYSTTDQQYIGYWTDENGNETEFQYEYFEKLYGGFSLTFFFGGPTHVAIEILTKNYWRMSMNTYFGGCEYDWFKYELSK
jgi:hypothetical protein